MSTQSNYSHSDLVFRFVGGQNDGSLVPVKTEKCFLGGEAESDAKCAVFRGPTGATIRSFGTEVMVNGREIETDWLNEGDQISVGSTILEVMQLGSFEELVSSQELTLPEPQPVEAQAIEAQTADPKPAEADPAELSQPPRSNMKSEFENELENRQQYLENLVERSVGSVEVEDEFLSEPAHADLDPAKENLVKPTSDDEIRRQRQSEQLANVFGDLLSDGEAPGQPEERRDTAAEPVAEPVAEAVAEPVAEAPVDAEASAETDESLAEKAAWLEMMMQPHGVVDEAEETPISKSEEAAIEAVKKAVEENLVVAEVPPVEATPVEATPVEAAPVEAAPVEAVEPEQTPEPVSAQPPLEEATVGQPLPEQPSPEQPSPEQPSPEQPSLLASLGLVSPANEDAPATDTKTQEASPFSIGDLSSLKDHAPVQEPAAVVEPPVLEAPAALFQEPVNECPPQQDAAPVVAADPVAPAPTPVDPTFAPPAPAEPTLVAQTPVAQTPVAQTPVAPEPAAAAPAAPASLAPSEPTAQPEPTVPAEPETPVSGTGDEKIFRPQPTLSTEERAARAAHDKELVDRLRSLSTTTAEEYNEEEERIYAPQSNLDAAAGNGNRESDSVDQALAGLAELKEALASEQQPTMDPTSAELESPQPVAGSLAESILAATQEEQPAVSDFASQFASDAVEDDCSEEGFQMDPTPTEPENESVAEVLARMKANGALQYDLDSEAAPESGAAEPEPSVQAAAPASPPPATEPVAESSDGEGDGDVEDYMSQLLQRLRGGEVSTAESQKAEVEKKQKEEEAQKPEVVQPVEPLKPSEYVPKSVAPEKTRNLDAMRELALQSTRSALDVSRKKQRRAGMNASLGLMGTGLAGSAVLMYLAHGMDMFFTASMVSLVVGILGSVQAGLILRQKGDT